MPRSRLEELEASGLDPHAEELLVVLVWLAAAEVELDEPELNAARMQAAMNYFKYYLERGGVHTGKPVDKG